jgi:uncharacterized protein YukE
MSIVGADLALLGQLVTKLGGPDKATLDGVLDEMNTAVQESRSYWVSEHGDSFRSGFAQFTSNVTRDLQEVLVQAARITGQNLTAIAKATGEAAGPAGSAGSAGEEPTGPLNGAGAANSSIGTLGTAGELGTIVDGVGGTQVNQVRVNAAVTYFNQHIGDADHQYSRFIDTTTYLGAQEVLQDWQKLTPAELNAALGSLTPAQLQELNFAVSEAPSNVQQDFAQMILNGADASTIDQLETALPNVPLEPSLPGGSGLTYQPVPGGSTLFGNGIEPNSQVNQGDLGDCYFLSSLAAVAASDPAFIQSHIRENANGTYTVTLYQNGHPVEVTVPPDLPANSDGDDQYDQIPGDGALYVAMYEKAYAQLEGGYGNIGNGGDPVNALATITGQSTTNFTWNNPGDDILHVITFGTEGNGPSLANIQAMVDSGKPVTACTTGNDVWPDGDQNDPKEIVGDHCYRVESVTTNPQTGQLEITVVNPWGEDGTGQAMETVTLTQQQFNQYFDEVAW